MNVRCKFKCIKVEVNGTETDPNYSAQLEAVTDGSEENKSFFRWTPAGSLRLSVCRESQFVEGKEYFLDISEA